jgi:hypothetical protein
MTLDAIKKRLMEIEAQGFVPSLRRGNTGIGYTLETMLGVKENNVKTPDFGEIELKSQRKGVTNKITLFTFNRGVWQVPQREVISEYGYEDEHGRQALYCFVGHKPNNQGLSVVCDDDALTMFHNSTTIVASWKLSAIISTFAHKMPAVVMVIADSQFTEQGEEFWFNEAYFLRHPNTEKFVELVRQNIVMLDVRMHLKSSGAARNHGTAFRIDERYLHECFAVKERLI